MNAILKRLAGGALLLSVLLVCAQARREPLTLNPVGGALSGLPGSTVGSGFTLTNDTGYYLVITGTDIDFSLPLGNFSDLIGPLSDQPFSCWGRAHRAIHSPKLSCGEQNRPGSIRHRSRRILWTGSNRQHYPHLRPVFG